MARFRLLEEDPGAGGGLRGLWPCPVTLDLPPLALGFPRCSVGRVRVGATPRALTCSGLSQRVRVSEGAGRRRGGQAASCLFHVGLQAAVMETA